MELQCQQRSATAQLARPLRQARPRKSSQFCYKHNLNCSQTNTNTGSDIRRTTCCKASRSAIYLRARRHCQFESKSCNHLVVYSQRRIGNELRPICVDDWVGRFQVLPRPRQKEYLNNLGGCSQWNDFVDELSVSSRARKFLSQRFQYLDLLLAATNP
jgi:hypothetical protein